MRAHNYKQWDALNNWLGRNGGCLIHFYNRACKIFFFFFNLSPPPKNCQLSFHDFVIHPTKVEGDELNSSCYMHM